MIRFCVVGRLPHGLIVERYFVRSWAKACMVRNELLLDESISRIVIVSLCPLCGAERVNGFCTNPTCVAARQPVLAASASV